MRRSGRMILVFLSVLLTVVMVIVTLIDVVEGPKDLFTSISVSIYLAVTTMATVGFGDRAEYRSRSIHLLRDDADRGGRLAVPSGILTTDSRCPKSRLSLQIEHMGRV